MLINKYNQSVIMNSTFNIAFFVVLCSFFLNLLQAKTKYRINDTEKVTSVNFKFPRIIGKEPHFLIFKTIVKNKIQYGLALSFTTRSSTIAEYECLYYEDLNKLKLRIAQISENIMFTKGLVSIGSVCGTYMREGCNVLDLSDEELKNLLSLKFFKEKTVVVNGASQLN